MLGDPVTRAAMAELAPAAIPGSAPDALADLHVRRERLIDLYTEGDIDRVTFRTRQGRLDEQIRATETGGAGDSRGGEMPSIPSTLDELVMTWDASGIDFQRQLIEVLISSVVVDAATSRRRAFDASRLRVTLAT